MERVYSPKQRELMELWRQDRLKRIVLLQGAVRSGKTWISLVLWAFWVGSMPKDGTYLMAARTLSSLQRNCLDLLQRLVGTKNFTYSLSKKEGRLFGRLIYLEGAGDVRAEGKIRGMTLQGAYCDEVILLEEEFFAMLLSRLSERHAKLFGTTNPGNPGCWLKTKYLDRADELDLLTMTFRMEDNVFLDEAYKRQLQKEYTGVFYERFVMGRWVAAEGTVYPLFADCAERFVVRDAGDIAFATIGVDFGGNKSAHAFVCNGFTRGMKRMVTLEEFYLKKQISPTELERYFLEFVQKCKEKYRVFEAYCDSAETTLIRGLEAAAVRERLGIDVRLARKGPIVDRIRFLNTLMSRGTFYVMEHCTHVIDALRNAVWEDDRLADRRLDDGSCNIDSLDALEYAAEAYMGDMMAVAE